MSFVGSVGRDRAPGTQGRDHGFQGSQSFSPLREGGRAASVIRGLKYPDKTPLASLSSPVLGTRVSGVRCAQNWGAPVWPQIQALWWELAVISLPRAPAGAGSPVRVLHRCTHTYVYIYIYKTACFPVVLTLIYLLKI